MFERMPSSHRPLVVKALRAFAEAAGEVPEQDWSLGWDLDRMSAWLGRVADRLGGWL